MRSFPARWALLALLALSLAAFAVELDTITDPQIAKLAQQFGPIAKSRLTDGRSLVTAPKNKALQQEREKLELVNDFMNRTPFISDLQHWGKEDYWATPVEFLSTNGGDCEDFSIAKYFALRSLGVPDEKLRITYVKEVVVYNEAHMVLAYFPAPDAEPLVLDNINKIIRPASTRTDLVPVYSFNGSGLWLAKDQTGRGQSVGGSDRIGHWKDVQSRLRAAM
ncbi:MAG TPA: transglutaminase-like cysteine peptidase [Burkholderiales bacterium]|jgi:predicted transglutaminase-like cysteine proteinase|nr:transglutaminase-like cysteine peptidase [Burkholderiales bacterium]